MVLLHGGAYADIDTESALPLDSLIQDDDAMLAAWEDEHSSVQSTMNAKFSRQRQVGIPASRVQTPRLCLF